ncbi:zinc-binding alcohol dehydrogenase family protein [Mucilaginibacter oryzae]|uniref:Zinc-binding alcohol dehydrogenase family protein n=1 Tax=Mucilaginibacter oryzae TaxID=468058 RepID=A0A316HC41_9SPHI|nr:zinc-binding dehydrogenase [Mucilaginibacter oryzae]PWK77591.1 zinc-binding alcohol dehydrogenase family protein [Mucilaginibacter oryzae]
MVIINAMKGREVQLDLGKVMAKRLTITGSMLRSREQEFKTAIARNLEQNIWSLISAGKIKPAIYKTFDAGDASAAHQLMESGEHTGKIVLTFAH